MFIAVSSLIIAVIPWMAVLIVVLAVFLFFIRSYFIRTSRDIKRLESNQRSPVYAQMSTTLTGLPVIRAHPGTSASFLKTFHDHQNAHSQSFFTFVAINRWLGIRLDMLTFLFVCGTAFGSVWFRSTVSAGLAGLILVYAIELTDLFQWSVRQSAEIENQMTSCERVVEYTNLPKEEVCGFLCCVRCLPGIRHRILHTNTQTHTNK